MVSVEEDAEHVRIPFGGEKDDTNSIYASIRISCSSYIEAESERFRADYSVTVDKNTYRPYGIRCVLLDEREVSIGEETAECRFATLDEAMSIMLMLVREAALPGTIKDILE